MNPAWLFAAMVLCLPGGIVLFRVLVCWLRDGLPMWLIRLFGLLSLGLVVSSSFAGLSYKGVCYSTVQDASAAFCLDQPTYLLGGSSGLQGSISSGWTVSQAVHVSKLNSCTINAAASSVSLSYTNEFGLKIKQGTLAATYAAAWGPGGEAVNVSSVTRVLTFPACDLPTLPTSADTLYVFSWGFGVILFFWSLGLAVGVARKLIGKV